jgi:hypothetical protein
MARMAGVLLFALLAGVGGTVTSVDQRPISKVLTLLKDMVGQLEKEAEEDAAVKEQYDCWCETGRNEKTLAITNNEGRIKTLTSNIESGAANSARLATEIANLEKEVAKNTEGLEKATVMRKEQLGAFTADEKSMLASIGQMKGAIETIAAKHEGSFDRASEHARTGRRTSFLQQSTTDQDNKMIEAIVAVQNQMKQHPKLLSAHDHEVVSAFLRASSGADADAKVVLLQQDTKFSPDHTSSSGQIFGVLKGMKESFETNLEAAQREETQNQADYEALKKAKTEEIAAGTNLADKKSTEKGNTDQKHAEDSQDNEDTERTLAADTDYLRNLKEQCALVDKEFFERTQTRQQETQAVSKALAFLNSDDAADLYRRTFGGSAASFAQLSLQSSRRAAGARILKEIAAKVRDPRLSALAVRVRSPQDAIDEVKDSIQDMIDKLVLEKEEEIKKKDYCVDNIATNERDTDDHSNQRDDHKYNIGELNAEIDTLTREIADLHAEIAATRVATKRASEDRESQNTEFQKTIADQRATRKLVAGALDILKGFYDKAALVQQPAGAPPPPGFKNYEKNAASGGVMGMMQGVINDAKAMEEECLKGEEDSQVAYESFITESNTAIVDMQKSITHKDETLAAAKAEKAQEDIELKGTEQELVDLKAANVDLHDDCDYTLKNFDLKQAAREDEIMGLKESVNIFSGGLMK